MPLIALLSRIKNKFRRTGDRVAERLQPALAQTRLAWRWHFRRRGKHHGLPGALVVSLTSYPPRFPTLALTLRCLLAQSVKADHTILWIAAEDMLLLPEDVKSLTRDGLEIRATQDLRSYKKIIPALREFPDAFIATADDDVYYDQAWLEELIRGAGPGKIVQCHRAHEITAHADGSYRPYETWAIDTAFRGESPALFATGVSGILYPPHVFVPEVMDEQAFLSLCPHGDDIWLYWMARRNGARYRTVGHRRALVNWAGSQETALWHSNLFGGRNDVQIKAMAERYGYPETQGA